jgi:serine/threonine protein phosphatase 1
MGDIAIGDVHGRLDALEGLLRRISKEWGSRFLVFVGDLVDRGPDSAGVIARVSSLVNQGRAACVLGNHDELFLQALLLFRPDLVSQSGYSPESLEPLVADLRFAPRRVLQHWISQGGAETIRSYRGKAARPDTWHIPPEDIAFLVGLPLAWRGSNMVVTHARAEAAAVETALAHREDPWLVHQEARHSLLWSRSEPQVVPKPRHVSGHTPREAVRRSPGAVEIDTGCVFGHRLTAYDPTTDAVVSIECVHNH